MIPKTLMPLSLMLVLALVTACNTHSEPVIEPAGTYADAYNPPLLIYATVNCDRLLPHAVLGMNRLGDFDLSINVIDDCTRAGGGYAYGEVLVLGKYSWSDSSLDFIPDPGGMGPFSGTFGPDSVRLTLPARTDSLAATALELRLPRLE